MVFDFNKALDSESKEFCKDFKFVAAGSFLMGLGLYFLITHCDRMSEHYGKYLAYADLCKKLGDGTIDGFEYNKK